MFPLAESMFPLAENMFPLGETVFPLRFSEHVCSGPERFLLFGTCLLGARTLVGTCLLGARSTGGRVAVASRHKVRICIRIKILRGGTPLPAKTMCSIDAYDEKYKF